MPQTRRLGSQRPLSKRTITRRRLRRTTWIDLVAGHNSSLARERMPNSDGRMYGSSMRGHAQVSFPSDESHHAPSSLPCVPERDLIGNEAGCDHSDGDAGLGIDFSDMEPSSHATAATDDSDMESNSDEEAAAKEFEDILSQKDFMVSPANVIALTLLCGTVKFSVKQYEIVRVLIKYASDRFRLPSYSMMQRKYFPHLIRNCFPRSTIATFPKKPGLDIAQHEGGRLCPLEPSTRIVFPTEWARLDVATLPYFENIFAAPNEDGDTSMMIEDSPIVRNREAIVDPSRYIFVEDRIGRIPAAAGDTISFKIRESIPEAFMEEVERSKFHLTRSAQDVHISAKIIATWCVGSQHEETESGKDAVSKAPPHLIPAMISMMKGSVPNQERSVGMRHLQQRSVQRFFANQPGENSTVTPGDICSLLVPNGNVEQTDQHASLCCVIVSRCLKMYEGMASQRVIWIRVEDGRNNDIPYSVINVQRITGTLKLVRRSYHTSTGAYPGHIGKLQDGRLFATYRVILYCDDFKSSGSLYSQASCGGVYLLPVGLSQKARRSRTAVHVISLTPPGVSTNEVLMKIIPDIVKGTTGVDGVLPSGKPVVIFLDVVGFVADYPAAAEPLDVLGHTADTPCTHCTIRKFKNGGTSAMGFSTNIHSSFSPSLRCAERHNALRRCELSNRELNILGMKPHEIETTCEYPLSVLREKLLAARPSIPLTSKNLPVVSGQFDPFRSSIVAPDHLLSGLARNITDLCFRVLSPTERKDLDIAICSSLAQNGLPRHRSVYNERKIQMHTMSLSSVFSVLLVLHAVCMSLSLPDRAIVQDVFQLIAQLKNLVSMTYWSPSVSTDGEEAHDMVKMESGRRYHAFLQGLAERYVADVDAFCASYAEFSSFLDKPNLHRLLELYHHSIPAYGHVSLFQELVFETAHQPLKRSVERGNHRSAEASAIEQCLGNDWQARIGMLFERLRSQREEERRAALNGLRELLIGRDSMWTGVTKREKHVVVDTAIEQCIHTPLLRVIRSSGTVNHGLTGRAMVWKTESKGGPPTDSRQGSSVPDIVNLLKEARRKLFVESGMFGKRMEDLKLKWTAKRQIPFSSVTQGIVSSNDVLTPGTFIQGMIRRCDENSFLLRPQTKGKDGVLQIFMVVGFVDGGEGDLWVAGVKCARNGRDLITTPKNMECRHLQLLHLNEGPRRIAAYHRCEIEHRCEIDHEARSVQHSETPLTGGSFRIQARSQGYPPRLA